MSALTEVVEMTITNTRIAELEKALRRCVEAIDATYDDTSEAHGLPRELRGSADAAKSVLSGSTGGL